MQIQISWLLHSLLRQDVLCYARETEKIMDYQSCHFNRHSISNHWRFGHNFTCLFEHDSYHVIFYCMYLVRQTWANSVDPDEMLQNVASHQGLQCLPLIHLFLDTTLVSKLYNVFVKVFDKVWKGIAVSDTKTKYDKETDTEIKWSIISKSVTKNFCGIYQSINRLSD